MERTEADMTFLVELTLFVNKAHELNSLSTILNKSRGKLPFDHANDLSMITSLATQLMNESARMHRKILAQDTVFP